MYYITQYLSRASGQVGERQEQRHSLKEKAGTVPLADKQLFCPLGCRANDSLGERVPVVPHWDTTEGWGK